MPKWGQIVFHPCRDFGVNFPMNQSCCHKFIQAPTQCGRRYAQCPLQFIETNSLCLVQEVIQDVEHVSLAEEVDESPSFGLKTNGALLVVWLHGDTKSLPYINNPVSA